MNDFENYASVKALWRKRGRSLSISLAAGLVALVTAFILSDNVLTAAYTFAPDGQVSSIDELYKLGSGPKNATIGIWLPLLLSAVASAIFLAGRHHRWAWIFPFAAIGVGAALSWHFIGTFQPPPPEVGG
jgi:hypothetical protein